ncbi:MAG: hypothetical protein ACJAWG_003293 [Candidatus Azotimanducaceae bacterium]
MSVLIRDVRAWHCGTPNLCVAVRCIPNIEYPTPWYRGPVYGSVPRETYDGLSEHGKHLCQYIVAGKGEVRETGYRQSLEGTPHLLQRGFQDSVS